MPQYRREKPPTHIHCGIFWELQVEFHVELWARSRLRLSSHTLFFAVSWHVDLGTVVVATYSSLRRYLGTSKGAGEYS